MKLTPGYFMVEPSFNQLKTFFTQIHENGSSCHALEHMILGNKNTLVLDIDAGSTFLGRKIRFVGSSYCEKLNAIRETMYQTKTDDVTLTAMQNLASLLREQFHEGNFVYEEKLADGTIQALASSNIADKLASGELKRVNKKGEEQEYSSLNTLSDAELEQLKAIADQMLSAQEIEAQRKKEEKKKDEKPAAEADASPANQQVQTDNEKAAASAEKADTAAAADAIVYQTAMNGAKRAQDNQKDAEQEFREEQKKADEKATERLAEIKKEEIKKQELKKEIVETEVEKSLQSDETVT